MNAPLYNNKILRLAATVPPARLVAPMATVEKRSPVCGSRVVVDVVTDADGRVKAIGLEVRACALGQAAATLMAAHAPGQDAPALDAARASLAAWLAGTGPVPSWPGIDIFTPALPHTARHPSICLAFEAVAQAASAAARR